MYRVGQGYDVHRLTDNRKLILGGIEIPFHKGLLGHSDADILLHAIVDAMLGALGLGDIGSFYPDDDMCFKDADSSILLQDCDNLIRNRGWKIVNIDSTIIAEKPRLKSYIMLMKQNIAKLLNLSVDVISIKAKTNEKLGYLGRQEAMAAQAIVLLKKTTISLC